MPIANSRPLHIDAWVGVIQFLEGIWPEERTTPGASNRGQTFQHPRYSRIAGMLFLVGAVIFILVGVLGKERVFFILGMAFVPIGLTLMAVKHRNGDK